MNQPSFIQIPTPVLKNKNLRPTDKFLFGYIYWLTKLKLEKCVATNNTLAELTGMAATSIQNALYRLEKEGYIFRETTGDIKNLQRTIHCLVDYSVIPQEIVDASNDAPPLRQMTHTPTSNDASIYKEEEEDLKRKGDFENPKSHTSLVAGASAKPRTGPQPPTVILEGKEIPDRPGRVTNELATLMLQRLLAIINPREIITQERVRKLQGRLQDYAPSQIKAAAMAFSRSEWHKENHQMSIDNLIAPSKFGRWYQQSQETGPMTGPTAEDIAEFEHQEEINRRFREGES